MGVLDNTSVTVDAILTKKGREKLAKGEGQFRITKFALGDDEVDYNLYDITHPNGSNFYGQAIENMNLLEAIPNQTLAVKYFLTSNPGQSSGNAPILTLTGPSTIKATKSGICTSTTDNFANELYDSDSCYDTSNKRFLPTTAGKYYIYAFSTFDAQGTDKFHSCYLSIYKNGSYYKQAYFDEYDNYLAYSKTPFVGATVDFNGSSDYVEIYATFNITSGTNHRLTGGAYSAFGGYKIIGA